MFLAVSLPANIVQSPDLQKNGNGSSFTQGSSVLGSAEKKDQISEEDQSLPARPLVWIYSLSSHPCPSCLFSKSDSLLSHYTTRFHRRHSLSLDSLHFVPNISFFLPLSFLHSSLQSGPSPPAWHGPLRQPHSAVLPWEPLATLSPLGAAKCSPAVSFLPQPRAARQEETVPKRMPGSLPLSPLLATILARGWRGREQRQAAQCAPATSAAACKRQWWAGLPAVGDAVQALHTHFGGPSLVSH